MRRSDPVLSDRGGAWPPQGRREGCWATRVGDAAPDFALPDQHGRPVRLGDRLALGPVAVLFTRGGWCPFCTILLRAWADALPALQEAGGDLLAVSPQPVPVCGSIPAATPWRSATCWPTRRPASDRRVAAHGGDIQRPSAWTGPCRVRRRAAPAVALRLGHDLPVLNGDGLATSWRAPLPGGVRRGPTAAVPDGRSPATHPGPPRRRPFYLDGGTRRGAAAGCAGGRDRRGARRSGRHPSNYVALPLVRVLVALPLHANV